MTKNLQAIRTALKWTIKNRRYLYEKDTCTYRASNCDWVLDLSFLDDTEKAAIHAAMVMVAETSNESNLLDKSWETWKKQKDGALQYHDTLIRIAAEKQKGKKTPSPWAILAVDDEDMEKASQKFVVIQEQYLDLCTTVYTDHSFSFWFNPNGAGLCPVLVWSNAEDNLLGVVCPMRSDGIEDVRKKLAALI